MPEITSCPNCDKKLRLPVDLFGKKVRCPGCDLLFTAQPYAGIQQPAAPRAAVAGEHPSSAPERSFRDDQDDRIRRREDRDGIYRRDDRDDYRERDRHREYDDDDDRDRRYDDDRDWDDGYEDEGPQPRLRDSTIRWKRVHLGLTLVLIGTLVLLALFVLNLLLNIIGAIAGGMLAFSAFSYASGGWGSAAGGLALVLGILILIGALGWFLLTLVGMGLCMMVPVAKRTKSIRILAIVAFSCTVGSLAFWPLSIAAAAIAYPLVFVVLVLALAVALTGFVCWILFLRAAAIGDPGLGHDLIRYMTLTLVFPFAAFFVQLVAVRIFPLGLLMILGIIILLCWLALFVWYAYLLYLVRADVEGKLPR